MFKCSNKKFISNSSTTVEWVWVYRLLDIDGHWNDTKCSKYSLYKSNCFRLMVKQETCIVSDRVNRKKDRKQRKVKKNKKKKR